MKLYYPPQEEEDYIAYDWARLLKLRALVIKKRSDTDQLAKDWENYVQDFKKFLQITKVAGTHENPEVADTPCMACME